jgi:site-specific DNA-methyltransferase (adenine-specific)
MPEVSIVDSKNPQIMKKEIEEYLVNREISPLILNGDVFDKLQYLPDTCIDLIITSPPYWQQRDYREENQIGREETSGEFIEKLVAISDELKRVLKDTGSFFLNIGDKYNSKKSSF